ncbi:MAG: DEAD/DEAH box helicase, partial [Bacteroidetes bacterium]|nr:DEAD/DEAH box helicase [Bacteroidota bacterium]
MHFNDYRISEDIKDNLDRLGFRKPTDIQFKSIPPILKGNDLLAIAQTGTGKTAAFVIPVLQILLPKFGSPDTSDVKCLVMAPTHELAMQIHEVFSSMAKKTGLSSLCIHGGVDQDPQIKRLKEGVPIVIATPGRMFDLVSQGYLKLNKVRILVLDEADHMLDLGFLNDIQQLARKLPNNRQTLFFSATINKKIKNLAYSLVQNPIRIQISPKDPVAKNINHAVAFIEMDDKRFFLERLVNENPKSKILVFVRTKVRAERVQKALERVKLESQTIHSDKEQKERFKVMQKFRDGESLILIATDVSARGIDIPDVDFVVNYDLPEQTENYVHRVGRTGRAKMKGQAVSFCSKDEKALLKEIETYLDQDIKVLDIAKKDYKETLDFSPEDETDWRSLIDKAEEDKLARKLKKK